MNQETIEDFKQKHFENYKNAVLETLKNNTISLFDDDVLFLLKKPPLDSMDVIKSKFLDLAKKQKIILDDIKLNKIIDDFLINAKSTWTIIQMPNAHFSFFQYGFQPSHCFFQSASLAGVCHTLKSVSWLSENVSVIQPQLCFVQNQLPQFFWCLSKASKIQPGKVSAFRFDEFDPRQSGFHCLFQVFQIFP